jgi:hypothetical protein
MHFVRQLCDRINTLATAATPSIEPLVRASNPENPAN